MARYYRRRYRTYRTGRNKYSNETTFISHVVDGGTGIGHSGSVSPGQTFPEIYDTSSPPKLQNRGYSIVPPTDVYGTRKVKNIDISLTTDLLSAPLVCALVYCPEGTLASTFSLGEGTSSLYEPNQNIIGQFVIPANGEANAPQITRFKTRLARNLDSGDTIVLIFGSLTGISANAETPVRIAGTVNYAIKY